jgi:hypothetical protein
MMILIFFFFLKPRFSSSHRKNLKISRNTLQSQILYPTDPNASVHVKYQSNKWSLSNPTHESKTGIFNDRQCSNKLNTPMTCNPQLRYKLCPINNIATNKKKNFIYKQKQIYTYKNKTKQVNKQTKQTKCLSTPPNLNDTLSPMWQEIHYSGMRNRDEQSPRRPPNLNIKTPVKN